MGKKDREREKKKEKRKKRKMRNQKEKISLARGSEEGKRKEGKTENVQNDGRK